MLYMLSVISLLCEIYDTSTVCPVWCFPRRANRLQFQRFPPQQTLPPVSSEPPKPTFRRCTVISWCRGRCTVISWCWHHKITVQRLNRRYTHGRLPIATRLKPASLAVSLPTTATRPQWHFEGHSAPTLKRSMKFPLSLWTLKFEQKKTKQIATNPGNKTGWVLYFQKKEKLI